MSATPETEIPAAHEDEPAGTEGPKKAISLRLPQDDLTLAKGLAAELEMGYQTLLCEVIATGLRHRQADLKYARLVEGIKASVTQLKAAQELADSPAVKAAKSLLESPAVKAAQALVTSPAVKAAEEIAKNPAVKRVREDVSASAVKAAQELAELTSLSLASPAGKLLNDFAATPAFKSAQELVNAASTKLAHEWENSPGGRLTKHIVAASGVEANPELQALARTVDEIKEALQKAKLMD